MRRFMSDLETTNDIKDCRVWLAGIAEIPEDHTTSPAVVKFNNLEGLMNYIEEQKEKVEIYFHNYVSCCYAEAMPCPIMVWLCSVWFSL